ncbi:hypothetical protein AB0I69_43060 [Streptomyces sp. NPDC050508]|uniref:hypothetical protein n=1 Tax=Streptomyces sp. NPDC050508 TaxID=3155405 RepID=UPI003440D449
MDYAFDVKNLPQPTDPAANDPGAPPPPQELQPPQEDDSRPWAGDVYDEGDETDPTQAYASFAGPSGEQAWLDKAEDGTLTGWVRDETGQVWRYADPEAWAIDVDDAGMSEVGTSGAAPGAEQPTDGEPTDPAAASDPASIDQAPEGGIPLDFGTADEVVPADGTTPQEPKAADPEAEETDEEPNGDEPAEDDEEEDDAGKGKRPNPFK